MTELTTAELVVRTLIVLGAIIAFAAIAIGGTWYFARPAKKPATTSGRGAVTRA